MFFNLKNCSHFDNCTHGHPVFSLVEKHVTILDTRDVFKKTFLPSSSSFFFFFIVFFLSSSLFFKYSIPRWELQNVRSANPCVD